MQQANKSQCEHENIKKNNREKDFKMKIISYMCVTERERERERERWTRERERGKIEEKSKMKT